MTTLRVYTAERILERLSDTERYPKEALTPYGRWIIVERRARALE